MPSYSAIKRLKIMIVDDHKVILKAISGLLAAVDITGVTLANSSEEALKHFNDNDFDVIICDIEMDGINGLELLRRIRMGKTRLNPSTAFIVLTSHAYSRAIGVAIALDVNGFLVKPTKLDQIFDKMDKAVNSNFKAKPPIAYEAVATGILACRKQTETKAAEKNKDPKQDNFIIEININDVNPGMTLYENVMHKNGVVIIEKDHCFSYASKDRLVELADELATNTVLIKIK